MSHHTAQQPDLDTAQRLIRQSVEQLAACLDVLSRERSPELDDWAQQVDFFEEQRSRLCDTPELLGKYVAIVDRKVVGSGSDQFALHDRLRPLYPDRVVLITRVERETPVRELPSPQVVR